MRSTEQSLPQILVDPRLRPGRVVRRGLRRLESCPPAEKRASLWLPRAYSSEAMASNLEQIVNRLQSP